MTQTLQERVEYIQDNLHGDYEMFIDPVKISDLVAEIDRLTDELKQSQERVKELERDVDVWHKMYWELKEL